MLVLFITVWLNKGELRYVKTSHSPNRAVYPTLTPAPLDIAAIPLRKTDDLDFLYSFTTQSRQNAFNIKVNGFTILYPVGWIVETRKPDWTGGIDYISIAKNGVSINISLPPHGDHCNYVDNLWENTEPYYGISKPDQINYYTITKNYGEIWRITGDKHSNGNNLKICTNFSSNKFSEHFSDSTSIGYITIRNIEKDKLLLSEIYSILEKIEIHSYEN